jgi:hypothetical protein
MLGIAFGLAAAALVGTGLQRFQRRRAGLAGAWTEAAQRAGLTEFTVHHGRRLRLEGVSGARKVCFQEVGLGEHGARGWLLVQAAPGIHVKAERWDTDLERLLGMQELPTGDEAFDQEVHVMGPPEVLRAVLDAETRDRLRRLVREWRVEMWERELHVPLPARILSSPEALAALLLEVLDLAASLDRPEDVVTRIFANTRKEPEWRVRLESVRLLLEKYPDHPVTRKALEASLHDRHLEVRLEAARASGDAGRATLLEMASLHAADDAYAARAILALHDLFPPDRASETLGRALRGRQVQTAMACLDRLGLAGGPVVVARLAKVLAVEEGPIGVAAARALGASGAAAAEAPLLEALARSSGDLGATAAEALGRVGSTKAVLPLEEAVVRGDAGGHLQREARLAVMKIQSRIQGASPGQLSLVQGEAGQVSLAQEDASGRLSLTKGKGAR